MKELRGDMKKEKYFDRKEVRKGIEESSHDYRATLALWLIAHFGSVIDFIQIVVMRKNSYA